MLGFCLAHEAEALGLQLGVDLDLGGRDLAPLLEELLELGVSPLLRDVLDLEVVERRFLALGGLLVLALHSQLLALEFLLVELLDGLQHLALLLEAHEPESLTVLLGVHGDLGAEHAAGVGESLCQLLGGDVFGQVLDDDVELGDQLGVLDLPHQAEFLAVELLVVFVVEGLLCLLLVDEVHLAET